MNDSRSSLTHPVDHYTCCFLQDQISEDVGHWHPLGKQFAEMLVLVCWVEFDVVEDLAELRLAKGQEIVGFERRREKFLREADKVELVHAWSVGLQRSEFDQSNRSL